LPTSSFDTFFACTIIVAVALIGTAFLGSTMQTRIASTQDINKDSYLNAIADHILTNPGSPADWGPKNALPVDFGLAAGNSNNAYELDIDKVSRLNSLNNFSISYPELSNAAKLNIALGIKVSQLMTVNVLQSSNSTTGSNTIFTFQVSADIDSKPTSANLHCYVVSDAYLSAVNASIPDTGIVQVTLQIPTAEIDNALLITFARASIDDRITSYAIYSFTDSAQQSTPSSTELVLSPLDYALNLNDSLQGLTVQNGYVFSYSHQQNLTFTGGSQASIPKLLDKSPIVLVVVGFNHTNHFQEWTAYPQVPLKAGANFDGSEQNVFSYIVTINSVLYRLDLSLGDLPQ
jgi:hypothetical protein